MQKRAIVQRTLVFLSLYFLHSCMDPMDTMQVPASPFEAART